MEEFDMLDEPNAFPIGKKSLWTTRLLAISTVSVFLALAISEVNSTHFIPHRYQSILLGVLNIVAVASALGGFIMGFTEWSYNKTKALIGIILNGIILMIYLVFAIFIFYMISLFGSPY